MAQKLLNIGLFILTVLVVLGVLLLGLFYDRLGIITLPEEVKAVTAWRPEPITIRVESQPRDGEPAWSNPLEALPVDELPVWTDVVQSTTVPSPDPTPSPTETPWPTATPIPPLDPAVYRTEVMLRLKSLAEQLERWLEMNDRLSQDWSLLDDPSWQAEMVTALRNIQTTGRLLGEVTPEPPEYAGIQSLLAQVGGEAEGLSYNYALAMQTRDSAYFTAAGDRFKRLKAYLTEAVAAMLDAGWDIQ